MAEILIVDDEQEVRDAIALILEDEGYRTRLASDGEAALAAIDARLPGLVLLDIWLEGSRLDGLEVLDRLRQVHPDLPVLVISADATPRQIQRLRLAGARGYLTKPLDLDEFLEKVDMLLGPGDA